MLKPPGPTIPGMTDTLDFVKNLWGSMHLPGTGLTGMSAMSAPPMSIEDLDKRIADLKAVESWLNLNVGMLRGSIQAIEVQRGTLVTLQSMGNSMAEAMRQSGASAEKMASMPFGAFFGQPSASGKPAEPSAFAAFPGAFPAASPAPSPAPASAAAPGKNAGGGGTAQPGTAAPAAADAPLDGAAAAAAAMGMPAAMAWWNMLQDQFTQAVNAAMTPAAAGTGASASSSSTAGSASAQQAGAQAKAAGNGDKAAGNAVDGGAAAAAPDGAAPADAKGAAGNAGAVKARASKPKSDKP